MTRTANRLDQLLRHRPPSGTAVEVAPYFNPALPKAAGNEVLIIDVFDTATLRERAKEDQEIPNERVGEIEEVDIVGDASAIGDLLAARGLTGKIGFVVSSHNFEHLPDPIRFLQGVESALMPGGVISMAIPDCRATFDHFRSMTRLVDWLAAHHDRRSQPSADTVFDLASNQAAFGSDTALVSSCDFKVCDPRQARLVGDLRDAYESWLSARKVQQPYEDSHVSVVFDAQFALLMEDLRFLGLIGLEVIEISKNNGHEFYAHLRRPNNVAQPVSQSDYTVRREILARRVTAESGDLAFPLLKHPISASMNVKVLARKLVGGKLYDKVRSWNRSRKQA